MFLLQSRHQRCEAGAVAGDGGLERQPLAGGHHRHPVPGERAADDHDVAGTGAAGGGTEVGVEGADAGGVDVQAVGLPPLHHFRVSGHHRNAGGPSRRGHRRDDAIEDIDRQPLLEHEAGREADGRRPHHRDVVERAVHGERTDVAAWKFQRMHDERVRRDGDLRLTNANDRRVAELGEGRVVEMRQERAHEQGGAHLAAGAVAELYPIGDGDRRRTGESRGSQAGGGDPGGEYGRHVAAPTGSGRYLAMR